MAPGFALHWVAVIAASTLLLVAAVRDLAVREIPNWIALGVVLAALPLRLATGDLPAGLGVALIVLLFLVLVWRLGALGGGDVKLWTAATLLVTPAIAAQLNFFLDVVLAGGVLALLYLVLRVVARRALPRSQASDRAAGRHRPRGIAARLAEIELWRAARGGPLPYAVAISAAGLLGLWSRHG